MFKSKTRKYAALALGLSLMATQSLGSTPRPAAYGDGPEPLERKYREIENRGWVFGMKGLGQTNVQDLVRISQLDGRWEPLLSVSETYQRHFEKGLGDDHRPTKKQFRFRTRAPSLSSYEKYFENRRQQTQRDDNLFQELTESLSSFSETPRVRLIFDVLVGESLDSSGNLPVMVQFNARGLPRWSFVFDLALGQEKDDALESVEIEFLSILEKIKEASFEKRDSISDDMRDSWQAWNQLLAKDLAFVIEVTGREIATIPEGISLRPPPETDTLVEEFSKDLL